MERKVEEKKREKGRRKNVKHENYKIFNVREIRNMDAFKLSKTPEVRIDNFVFKPVAQVYHPIPHLFY